MIAGLLMLIFGRKKFIPYQYNKTIFDVDYSKLYEIGCRYILTDLDNTLVSYIERNPSEKLISWRDELKKLGFTLMIVSNSHSNRVKEFAEAIALPCQYGSLKPTKKGFKKAVRALGITDYSQVVVLGDQILTDILGGNRMGFKTILIEAIDRESEFFSTRFNRRFERKIVKRIKKKDPDGVLKDYE